MGFLLRTLEVVIKIITASLIAEYFKKKKEKQENEEMLDHIGMSDMHLSDRLRERAERTDKDKSGS